MSMPINKEVIEKMYYRWWLELCKTVSPEQRNRLRCALSIIEAYRSDFIYEIIRRLYANESQVENFDSKAWEVTTLGKIEAVLANDKKRVAALAKRCPNLLIGIAGVINGVRRAKDIRSAFSTILLLDIVDNNTIQMLDNVELENVRFIKESKSIYLPLREPEVYSVVKEVERLLFSNATLRERITKEYGRREALLSSVLGIRVELAEDVA